MAVPMLSRSQLLRLPQKRAARSPFSAAGFSSSSGGSSPRTVPAWSIPYRQRLGIGDSLVVHRIPAVTPWEPPKLREIKIEVAGMLVSAFNQSTGELVKEIPSISAVAINSSGHVLAEATAQREKFESPWRLQLYALKAGGNLKKWLEEEGKHFGLATYETKHKMLAAWFGEMPVDDDFDPEVSLRRRMPDDLDDVECEFEEAPRDPRERINELLKGGRIKIAKVPPKMFGSDMED